MASCGPREASGAAVPPQHRAWSEARLGLTAKSEGMSTSRRASGTALKDGLTS